MFRLLKERPADLDEVEALYDLAFAPGRGALSSYQLRADVPPVADLCYLARDEYDAVVAAIRYWPVRLGPLGAPALLLGPVAVHPTRQGEGLGALMIAETLDRAGGLGWARVLLVGDEPYYSRFGFTRALTRDLDFPRPINLDRLLARELIPNSMSGMTGLVRKWAE
ncbi:MAG: N-acetyltransferase [Pseudomonadota bacterium]